MTTTTDVTEAKDAEKPKSESAPRSSHCYTASEWRAEAERLFGPDELNWKFRCPACKHEASIQEYKDAGAPSTAVAFSCVGRWSNAKREAFGTGEGPCNYAGGGLIALNPVTVTDGETKHRVFDFAV